jgi:hypothetical protein
MSFRSISLCDGCLTLVGPREVPHIIIWSVSEKISAHLSNIKFDKNPLIGAGEGETRDVSLRCLLSR